MVTVGFVVEGPSDKKLVESKGFQQWLQETCNLEVVSPVVDAGGNGEMCNTKIGTYIEKLKMIANPDKTVVLADLDPDICAPCITRRKEIIGSDNIDLVVIARKAMESWFLADTEAMRSWTNDSSFYQPLPEATDDMPWDLLREIGLAKTGRGPGSSKVIFAKKFINKHGFDVMRAANHPDCPSARYFVDRLCALGHE
ncbi:MAG: hypothetical protein HOD58_11685 [Gammaproteobacteria bacterium]|jgi:hypothetical protein|nr:hypothetical protein [Gammaproteobacteria bacterium]MBT6991002.1 hypothetical protein [Gammaproteobacteria bacterium]MBT7914770.1 hypothetical protein [Candidatus Bathyarchaeota archaeon]